MAKYLITASYSAEGTKGLLKDGGSARKEAATKLAEDLGGNLECFYFAFGSGDAYVIVDVPNEIAAAAMGLRINSTGLVSVSTTALLTPEQIDAACDKGTTLGYKAPGT